MTIPAHHFALFKAENGEMGHKTTLADGWVYGHGSFSISPHKHPVLGCFMWMKNRANEVKAPMAGDDFDLSKHKKIYRERSYRVEPMQGIVKDIFELGRNGFDYPNASARSI